MNISSVLYIIVLVVCSLSGIQGRPIPQEGVVYLWAEYLELILPDYYMITSQNILDIEKNEVTDNDRFIKGIWCLHNMMRTFGTFYYPNGTEVAVLTGTFSNDGTTNTYSGPDPIFQTDEQFTYTVLLRDEDSTTPIASDYEGLYRCIIDDRTLVVGVYNTSTYNNNTGPKAGDMALSLISTPRYVDPPVFNLRFMVTNGPPTDVTCTGPNSFSINQTSDDLSREVVNDGTATLVTVTVRMREEGNYQCTVSNARVENGTINGVTATPNSTSLSVSVSDTPTHLTLTRLGAGLLHVQVSWTGSSPRYEVFYSLGGSNDIQSLVNTADTTYSVTSGLTQDQTYEFFVVSYGNDDTPVLPSVNSSIESVTLTLPSVSDLTATSTSNTITLTWTEPDPIPSNGYSITRQCCRLCEESFNDYNQKLSSSPSLVFSDISPGSYCTISLFTGIFGTDTIDFDSGIIVITISVEPTSPPENVFFSSVEARSFNITWEEVPCSGQNGPITGYLLYYTNTTFSDTINITGGENRSYTLTELRPYTNYTVTVSAYNDGGNGPTNDDRIQQTEQAEPGAVSNLMSGGSDVDQIDITWNQPSIPNGIIIVYDIHYRKSDNSDSFVYVNGITNTQHIIDGLIPNTSYTIRVRAYTIAGPGEWTAIQASTLLPGIEDLIVEILEDIVFIKWTPLNYTELTSYVLQYKQTNEQTFRNVTFLVSIGLPTLQHDIEYVFQVYGVFTINNVEYESERSPPVTIMISSSTTSSNDSQTGSTGLVAGVSVLSILIVVIIVITVTLLKILIEKPKKKERSTVKSSSDIVAYETIEDSKKDIEMKECQAYGHFDISPQQQEQQDDANVYEAV